MYDVIIIGAGPGGIFTAYELTKRDPPLKIAVIETGHSLQNRQCPIEGDKVKTCINCKSCSIMSGFGGAGAFSHGKYNITNDFGGTLHEHIGKEKAPELMQYVDNINMRYGGQGTKLYSTAGSQHQKDVHAERPASAGRFRPPPGNRYQLCGAGKSVCLSEGEGGRSYFDTPVETVRVTEDGYRADRPAGRLSPARHCVISVGRSGSKWMENICRELHIPTKSNRVDIGVRVELPAEVFLSPDGRALRKQDRLPHRKVRRSGAHLLHESQGRGGERKHQRHYHRQRPQLRRSRPARRKIPILRCWSPSTFPSPSRIPTATASPSPA